MRHCGTKVIETERLILRQFEMDDKTAMFNNWASDTDVAKYLTWPAHDSVELTGMFFEAGFERIYAGHDINNPKSGRVMEKIGMKKEGIHRKAGRNNTGIVDMVYYAILKEDVEK